MTQNIKCYDEDLDSGRYFFKYCRFDINSLQIILNKTLYFSSPDKLNDPLDSRYNIRIKNPENFSNKTKDILNSSYFLSEEIKNLLKNVNLEFGKLEIQEQLFKEYFSYLQNTYYGICCFSKVHSQNLLWSHYSNDAKGLCLVFDKEMLLENLRNNLSKSRYWLIDDSIKYKGVKKLEVTLKKNGGFSCSIKHLFSKTSHWKYEQEHRLLLSQKPKDFLDFNPIRFNPFLKFENDSLKFIIIGERMLKEQRKMLFHIKKDCSLTAELLFHKFDY